MRVKVNGAWVDTTPHVKVAGEWKPVNAGYTKVNGEWKPFYAGSGKFYAIREGNVYSSTNAIDWTQIAVAPFTVEVTLQKAGSRIFALGKGVVAHTTDMRNWTIVTPPGQETTPFNGIVYKQTSQSSLIWVLTSKMLGTWTYTTGRMFTSSDLTNWTQRWPNINDYVLGYSNPIVTPNGTIVVAFGNYIYTSTTGTGWTLRHTISISGFGYGIHKLLYSEKNSMIIGVGDNEILATSTDNGTTWTSRLRLDANGHHYTLEYYKNYWYSSTFGKIRYTSYIESWPSSATKTLSGENDTAEAIVIANDIFVIAIRGEIFTYHGENLVGTSATSWVHRFTPPSSNAYYRTALIHLE